MTIESEAAESEAAESEAAESEAAESEAAESEAAVTGLAEEVAGLGVATFEDGDVLRYRRHPRDEE